MFKKIKGHYVKDKKSTDRSVLSYEDVPLDDYEQEKTDLSPAAVKKIVIGICIALAAGLIVFAFSNRDKLTWDNISSWWTYDVLGNAGNGYPVSIVGSEVPYGNFYVNQSRVAYASDTSFVSLNSTGSEIANLQLRHSNPAMRSDGNCFITYGIGSTGYQIQSFDKLLYTGETDYPVYTADIASNGVYATVTSSSGYFSELSVFDKDNNRIFKYSFSEYYVTGISLNSNGTGCVAYGVTTVDGGLQTGIYILDFKQEKPVSTYKINDDMIVDSEYLNDSSAVLVGQSASYIAKKDAEKIITKTYDGKSLANYCFNRDTNQYTLALSRSGDGKSCALETYDDNGEKKSTVNTEYAAESISTYKGVTAILDNNTAYVYDSDGTIRYTSSVGTGSKRIILTSEKDAYILSTNQIRSADLSRTVEETTAAGKE